MYTVGVEVMNSVGGFMSALYGTMFIKLSTKSMGKTNVSGSDLSEMSRACRLGERTIGHFDAGATSCYFIRRAFETTFK